MITWLASFPKSGNTWARQFLSAYIQDCAPDINDTAGSYTDQIPDAYNPGYGIEEVEREHEVLMRPAALLRIAYSYAAKPSHEVDGEKIPLILKTHSANAMVHGIRTIPPSITDKVVLIVRDPRDVAMSFAKHFGLTLDEAIESMTDSKTTLFDERSKGKPPHHTMSWRDNLFTYASATDLTVTVIKFEQLKEDPVKYFSFMLKWIGIEVDPDRVKRAVKNCELSKLRKQEKKHGFIESSHKTDRFFGKGKTGGWKGKMTKAQEDNLIGHCRDMMSEFGYLEKANG